MPDRRSFHTRRCDVFETPKNKEEAPGAGRIPSSQLLLAKEPPRLPVWHRHLEEQEAQVGSLNP